MRSHTTNSGDASPSSRSTPRDRIPDTSIYAFVLSSIGGPFVLLVLLLAVVAATAGCSNRSRVRQLEAQTEQVRDSLKRVIEEQRALRKESERRAKELTRANQLITDVVSQLAELSRREESLREAINRTDDGDVESVELSPDAETVETAIERGLADVEAQLEESRAALNRLEEQRQELTVELDSFKQWTTELRDRLEEREETVGDLRERVRGLVADLNRAHQDNEELRDTTRQLRSRNADLQRAYVVTADADSLAAMGVLDRPLLGFLGEPDVQGFDRTKFRRIETGTTRIALPSERAGVKIHSPHRHETDLFEVSEDELVIRDPGEFWAVSRYLVVEVDR